MVSERARSVDSFLAMDVLERANEREDVVHLEVGEPDFDPPEAVFDAAVDSLRGGNTGYTVARGKPELRRAIAARYDRDYGVAVDPDRIVVTPGSSPGLLLALATLVDPGDEVVLTDPHYASYPKFVRFLNGVVRTVPLRASEGFRPRAAEYDRTVGPDTSALVVNSPANPTGAVLDGETLGAVASVADAADATVVSDEIYHGLSYGAAERTMLEFTDEAFVLDGFSKRYGMTGWRLGWVVAPPGYAEAVNRLAQHVLISAPNFVQDAGVAALATDESWLADVRDTYRRRRDRLLDAVADWGLDPDYAPEGAYYVLADVSGLPGSSVDVADLFLEEAGVAVTPGADFGERASDYVRLSYATDEAAIDEAATRIDRLLDRLG
ncbi:pyridoxal phosphate-dependent aminotransferase (aspartate aminotransferase) [Halosimplex carlsbadense 2-9-1]|uniref:Aminotransferase n=1 Tax=Halosimplex carlsbadense 2-9-1 TaxID=797114 RepID=M0CQF0_9EURY|nr:pyridoxal phosphate-dependent aminotransferase [Halosimplex carlsbadense]ELZ24099.1 pyridoxal phosphate-dependent aminotransferase (aspartate aminotransferase) [Halosimplex carlsbadense 2-9-1]